MATRGGARPGAGRPQEMPDAVRTITFQIPVELLRRVDGAVTDSRAAFIRAAIELYLLRKPQA